MQAFATFLEVVLAAEDSRILLHSLLHAGADLGSGAATLAVAKLVKKSNRLLTSILLEGLLGSTLCLGLLSEFGSSTTEHNKIEERVSTKTVSTVN